MRREKRREGGREGGREGRTRVGREVDTGEATKAGILRSSAEEVIFLHTERTGLEGDVVGDDDQLAALGVSEGGREGGRERKEIRHRVETKEATHAPSLPPPLPPSLPPSLLRRLHRGMPSNHPDVVQAHQTLSWLQNTVLEDKLVGDENLLGHL